MKEMSIKDWILYEDREILVCHKPAGFPVQSRKIGSKDMESVLRNYRAGKGEEPYAAVIHRLDQPVEGILVFGKTKRAASDLSAQVQDGRMEKFYLAVTCGIPEDKEGRLENELVKDGKTNTSKVVKAKCPQSKKAVLEYKVLRESQEQALVEIHLLTGRHHQIRVQMSYAGFPLWGDTKYNIQAAEARDREWQQIALCAYKLAFWHPVTKKKMEFEVKPSGNFPIV